MTPFPMTLAIFGIALLVAPLSTARVVVFEVVRWFCMRVSGLWTAPVRNARGHVGAGRARYCKKPGRDAPPRLQCTRTLHICTSVLWERAALLAHGNCRC